MAPLMPGWSRPQASPVGLKMTALPADLLMAFLVRVLSHLHTDLATRLIPRLPASSGTTTTVWLPATTTVYNNSLTSSTLQRQQPSGYVRWDFTSEASSSDSPGFWPGPTPGSKSARSQATSALQQILSRSDLKTSDEIGICPTCISCWQIRSQSFSHGMHQRRDLKAAL